MLQFRGLGKLRFSPNGTIGCSHGREPMVNESPAIPKPQRGDMSVNWFATCRPFGTRSAVGFSDPWADAHGYIVPPRCG